MKKYLAGLAAVSVAGGAAPTLDSVQAAPEQNTQKAATQAVQASASNSSSYTVNADVLHVRAGSSTSHDIISRVYNGQSLNVIGEENGWFKINHNGQTGYVSSEFVSKNGATNNNVSTGGNNKVTADVLRVRTGPSTSSSVSGRVYEGQALNVIGQENGWVKIKHNGQVGYVSSQFVSGASSNTGSTNSNNNEATVQPASGNYTVNVSSLRVRTGPSTSHPTVGSVKQGQVVQVVGEVQDWFKINYAGQTAYLSKDYVTKGGSNENVTQGNNQGQNNNVTVQTGGTYVVNATSLRVRTGPATYHSVIGGVLNGTTLNVIGSEGSWFKVNYQGKTGYVSSEFMKFVKGGTATPEQPEQPKQPEQGAIGDYYINASALNVRSGEGTNYRIIGALPQGQKVQVISENYGWSKINYNGQTGYIGTRFLSKTPVGGAVDNKPNNNQNNNQNNNNNNNTSNNSGDSSSLLAYAKSMQGVPYVWGGTSANGVDCSGYIYHVYKKFGHNISRQSVAGYWSSLPQTSSPQPGDLIYFKDTYKAGPSHMGIYLGGGSFIQAGDKGVAIVSLSNSYWKSHFLGYTKAP
ncbi:SH3 domain-containing protein [Bacillus paramycoides]|uniref:C40 family peptidase n=1 Tax=Bacillus paramycoides TaxID=2026194 RepID=UPI002244EB33|nr:C40 family peptidase [Bacillus paramycoides]MCW9132844.1 SH3 domain-containing protein [Bacillus paramycoides]